MVMRRRVPAWPLRRMLLGWQARYSDDLVTIAAGFDLPVQLMSKLLGAEPVRRLRVDDARACCVGLRLHPEEIWPPNIAVRLGPVGWETETFWVDVGVDPMLVRSPGRRAGAWTPNR